MTKDSTPREYLSQLGKKSWEARKDKYGEKAAREILSAAGKRSWSEPEAKRQRDERDKRIHSLRKEGMTLKAIAEAEGVTVRIVHTALNRTA